MCFSFSSISKCFRQVKKMSNTVRNAHNLLAQTKDEIAAAVRDQNIDAARIIKVLPLGNSGVGKSFLCNALVGADVFEHKCQTNSCTDKNTFLFFNMNGQYFLICNIPGLIEAKSANIERNKKAIKDAFEFLPDAPTVAVFVVSQIHGRPLPQDHQAIRSTCAYIEIGTEAMAMLVNGVDFDELDESPADTVPGPSVKCAPSRSGRPCTWTSLRS